MHNNENKITQNNKAVPNSGKQFRQKGVHTAAAGEGKEDEEGRNEYFRFILHI